MDDTEIAVKLGQLLAGQDNINRDISRFREESATASVAASESRRVLYRTISELKDKLVTDINEIRINQKLLDQRLEDNSNKLSLWQPNILDIPRIQSTITSLESSVTSLKEAKLTIESTARGALMVSRLWWVILVGISSTVGAAFSTFWHWVQAGGGSPGR